jgi:hypothetical protein
MTLTRCGARAHWKTADAAKPLAHNVERRCCLAKQLSSEQRAGERSDSPLPFLALLGRVFVFLRFKVVFATSIAAGISIPASGFIATRTSSDSKKQE